MVVELTTVFVPSTWKLPVTVRLLATVVVASVTVTLADPPVLNLIVSLEGKLIAVSVSPICLIESAIKSSSPFTVTSPPKVAAPPAVLILTSSTPVL